jgi:phosphoribosylformimino-5-aminoimidazole carboxamide ribonucleotide (ProFAR) isomerase
MIVPSIDIMDGRAVQLRRGREFVLDGGDPIERLEEFSIAGVASVAASAISRPPGAGSTPVLSSS